MWPPVVATATGCTHTVAPGEKLKWKREWDAERDETLRWIRWSQGREREGKKEQKKL